MAAAAAIAFTGTRRATVPPNRSQMGLALVPRSISTLSHSFAESFLRK